MSTINIEPAYIEAKYPNLQAAYLKMFRQMSLGSMSSLPLPIGLLDNGSVFSPTQAMIDLDINYALYKLSRGFEVNEETMCKSLINEMGFCEHNSYLNTDHTFENFKSILWDTKVFDRTAKRDPEGRDAGDDAILDKADAMWRELEASQQQPETDAGTKAEIDRIVEAAKKDLLG